MDVCRMSPSGGHCTLKSLYIVVRQMIGSNTNTLWTASAIHTPLFHFSFTHIVYAHHIHLAKCMIYIYILLHNNIYRVCNIIYHVVTTYDMYSIPCCAVLTPQAKTTALIYECELHNMRNRLINAESWPPSSWVSSNSIYYNFKCLLLPVVDIASDSLGTHDISVNELNSIFGDDQNPNGLRSSVSYIV